MFGGGFFGGGFPGGGGFGEPRSQKSDNTKYYKLLGVDRNASEAELKKAHRKLALKHHPDKQGGDAELFKEINTAYDVLRDPEKRKIYDQYGEDAVKDGSMNSSSMGGEDIFSSLFGGGGGRRQRERRSDNVTHTIKVSLEEMYNGTIRKLALTKNSICKTCNGPGTKSGRKYECEACRGTGVQVMMRPLGPGMMQQIQQPCSRCNQTGYSAPKSDVCTSCNGKGLQPEKKVFEVHVEKGHKAGSKIIFRGEAGRQDADMEPGDVIFQLEPKANKTFRRIGSDLIIEREITLGEALCGLSTTVKHLDNRILKVVCQPGEINKPDCWKRVPDEGMPEHGRPYEHGNLYIHFSVSFPENLTPEQVNVLQQVLGGDRSPNGDAPMDTDAVEEVSTKPVTDIEEELRSRRQAAKHRDTAAYDSSDDEDGGKQRVQCAQQ